MTRRAIITAVILLMTGSAFAVDLFTINVPMDFTQIPPNITHVTLRCELRGLDLRSGSQFPLTYAAKGYPTQPLMFPLGACGKGGIDPVTGVSLASGCFRGEPVVIFTSDDFANNPAPLNDPNGVNSAVCYFGLRDVNGTHYQPTGFLPGTGLGDGTVLQPPAGAWPPGLQPLPNTPYIWQSIQPIR